MAPASKREISSRSSTSPWNRATSADQQVEGGLGPLGHLVAPGLHHLDRRRQRHQRRAQLVADVGREAGVALDALLQRRGHVVERARRAAPRSGSSVGSSRVSSRPPAMAFAACAASASGRTARRRAQHAEQHAEHRGDQRGASSERQPTTLTACPRSSLERRRTRSRRRTSTERDADSEHSVASQRSKRIRRRLTVLEHACRAASVGQTRSARRTRRAWRTSDRPEQRSSGPRAAGRLDRASELGWSDRRRSASAARQLELAGAVAFGVGTGRSADDLAWIEQVPTA